MPALAPSSGFCFVPAVATDADPDQSSENVLLASAAETVAEADPEAFAFSVSDPDALGFPDDPGELSNSTSSASTIAVGLP
jgi:hypothetical protein